MPLEVQMWQSVAGPSKIILHLFMHLADAFIQRALHSIQGIYQFMHSLRIKHLSLALLASCCLSFKTIISLMFLFPF